MKYCLYRFNPDEPRVKAEDFVAIEIARTLDGVVPELTQDALGDLYVRHGLEPEGLETTTFTELTDKRFPHAKYLLKITKKERQSESTYYYGVSEAITAFIDA